MRSRPILSLSLLVSALLAAAGCADADPAGDSAEPGDCADVQPGALDLCDGLDGDCDGQVDEDAERSTWYMDGDGDGYGDEAYATVACAAPEGSVALAGDCDDGDPDISPDATERCGGVDEDCDGLEGDADPSVSDRIAWFIDEDGDGFGSGPSYRRCEGGDGYVDNDDDCDDQDASLTEPTDWYRDGDGDGYGGAELLAYCGQPTGYVADSTDCDDDDDQRSPGLSEVCLDEKDNDCDGTDNGCVPVSGDTSVSAAEASVTGTTTYFGMQLRPGDTDGDGVTEVITSAPYEGSSVGAIYVFSDLDRGDTLSPGDAEGAITGTSTYPYLGYNLGSPGDVDGDGYDDLLSFSCSTLMLSLIEGPIAAADSASRITTSYSGLTTCANANKRTLHGVDRDGDGTSNLIIGAPYASHSSDTTYSGEVYVLDDPGEGSYALSDAASVTVYGESAYGYMGADVAALGDLDGDGVRELAFGAYANSDYNSSGGAVGVLTGESSGVVAFADVDRVVYGSYSGQYAGYDVNDAGDVDGDGRSDLILTAYYDASFTGTSAGAAYIFLAPVRSSVTETSSADVAFYGTSVSTRFAQQLGGPLDMNGDEVGDVALADPSYGSYAGATSLYYGPFSLGSFADTDADARILGAGSSTYSSYDIAGVGDLNADGYDDLAINVYGSRAFVLFFGGTL